MATNHPVFKPVIIVVSYLTVCLSFIGLYLVWTTSQWTTKRKWVWTAPLLVYLLLVVWMYHTAKEAADVAALRVYKMTLVKHVGLCYLNYCEMFRRPPTSRRELMEFLEEGDPTADWRDLDAILRNEGFTIRWGVDPLDRDGEVVLGFERWGGYGDERIVLFANSRVMEMTQDELREALEEGQQ